MPDLHSKTSYVIVTALLLAATNALAVAPDSETGGELDLPHVQHLSDIQRLQIEASISKNVNDLVQGGAMLPQGNVVTEPRFIWPVRKAAGVEDFNVDAISNYVDQDGANPNSILDYYCGTRTYDFAGYDHAGIDIFSWPFYWHKQNNDEVEIIAAAPGIIVDKSDGNDDQSCGFGGGNWNAVYIQHADGSQAWYGHMKKNSLTSKAIGESVVEGEYLGVVGSSGNSTGPHLHMEVYDSQNQLIDPYAGVCNTKNANSWWQNQDPYYVPRLNALGIGTDVPAFNACPQPATTYFENTYFNADPLIVTAYYRDQLNTTTSNYSIEQPNGAVYASWTHTPSAPHYTASWWGWQFNSLNSSDTGIWKFKVDYEAVDYAKEFYLVDECTANITVPAQQLNTAYTYGATNSITTNTNSISVGAGARLTLLAGNSVSIGDGFSVAGSGQLTIKNVAVCN